ncbi:hypothetical protein F6P93_23440 (plasmid) [Escherichia coli]|nr:hypothetical protein F6P93_23440 [Escherichia coli]
MRLLENENVLRKRLTMLQSIYKFLFNLCSSPVSAAQKTWMGHVLPNKPIISFAIKSVVLLILYFAVPQMLRMTVERDGLSREVTTLVLQCHWRIAS